MNDRIYTALAQAGISQEPLASLDYEQQLFVLTSQSLIFQVETDGPLQQVALRDVTRIHSDQTGTLRIEAGPRTAITASLLGYDPDRVQRFFQLVRDATARAKQLPSAPAVAPTQSFFGKVSSPVPTPVLADQLAAAPKPSYMTPIDEAASTIRIAAEPPSTDAPVARPVAADLVAGSGSAHNAPAEPPATPRPQPAASATQLELLRRAKSVGGLSGTVQVLALVLALGSLGMGYVMWQKQSQHVPALWTVTIGLVTAVALLVLGQVLRMLAALGQSVAEAGR